MSSANSSEPDLLAENLELRAQLEETQETLRAIRAGEVDALVVEGETGPRLFVLQSTDADANRFRSDILALVSESIIALDSEQRVTYFNAAAELSYGVAASEALGRSLSEIFEIRWLPPDDDTAVATSLRQQGHWRGENVHVKRNGETIHVESSVSLLPAKDDRAAGMLLVIRDITEQSRAKEALRESEARYRSLFNSIDEGFCIIEVILDAQEKPVDYRFLHVSPSFEKQTGLVAAEGRTARELVPHLESYWFEIYGKVALSGEPVRFENRAEPLHRWYDVYASRFGAPESRQVAVVFNDITDRKISDEALRNNEALFSTIIDQAPGGVYVVDGAFRILQVNALARPTFAAAEPVIGRDFTEVMRILWGPELGPELAAIFRHTLETGERYVSERFTHERFDLSEEKSYEWETQRLTLPNGKHGVVCYFADVTERERAAAALRESENFNRSIVESSRDCIKVLDLEGRFISMSARGQQLLGIGDFGPFVGKSWIEMWEGADRNAARAAVQAAAAGGSGGMVGRTRTLRGEFKWFDVALSAIRDANGAPVRLLAASRDITDRRRTEWDARFLAEVSQDLAVLSSVPELMETVAAKLAAHLDLSLCNFVDIDEAAEESVVTWAWHRPDVPSSLGRYRLADYLSSEFQETLRAGRPFIVGDTQNDPRTDAARYAALKIGSFVCMPLVQDGKWRFMLNIHHSEAHDWEPEEIELTRELTTRIWTRLERLRIESALHESEARFRMMADAITQLAWIARSDGHIVWYNQRWYDFTGTTTAQMEGWGWQRVHDPEVLPRVLERWKQSIDSGEPFDMTFPLRGADGTFRPFLTRVIPLKDAAGRVMQWFGTNTDVSELKRVEQALADRVADLAQADRSKDEFLAMLAHELRNPLAPLRHATEILRGENFNAEECANAHDVLTRQIGNMSRMIDDLLDVSRITEGKIELRKQAVDLAPIIEAAASLVRPSCVAHRQEMTVVLPGEPVFLDGDATRLEQIFGNLLGNASKYSGDGSQISISAERAAQSEPPEVVIRVRDNGPGIAPDLLPHIFDLFVQASRTLDRTHGGLGIGLTIVQRLVKLHGGVVEARSGGPAPGAEFVVRLPILREAPPPTLAPTLQIPEIPRRILIVDDNTDSASSLALLQKRRGHETRLAFNGPDAVALAGEFHPQAVLLDIGLPTMDGFEVARQIRQLPGLERIFIVALSGYDTPKDRSRAREIGFDEYLVKPADLALLKEWLQTRIR